MNEEQILSEYLDGELPADLVKVVESRLARDGLFRARYERLVAVQRRLRQTAELPEADFIDSQARVWQKLQRNLSPRPSRIPAWVAALGDLIASRVSLPVPAMAGLAVVFMVLALMVAFRPAAAPTSPAMASAAGSGQAVMSLPSINQTATRASEMGITPAALSAGTILPLDSFNKNGTGMAVTIEVQNLRQLLSVLENNQGIREFSIQLPQQQSLEPVGEPALLSASDLAKMGNAGTGK